MATYNVGGFTFTNETEAKRAKQELQLIEQLKARTDISKPAIAKQLLENCRDKGTFKTKVGMVFLNKLQQTAKSSVNNKQFNKPVSNTPVNRRATSVYSGRGRNNFMYCDECGSMLEDESLFCTNCGKSVRQSDKSVNDTIMNP